ncbi:MAG: hydrolase family protein [Paucimonas sp.]|jgi:lysophospholipase L1-like esterase|nr:hydrolase family protein [Paucimonas sp.]
MPGSRSGLREWLPEALALALLPLLVLQGRRTRARVARLPEPTDPASGLVGTAIGKPLTLLLLGESPVAGVGVSSHAEGVGAATAAALATASGRKVQWQALGVNGITVGEAASLLLPRLQQSQVDIACIAFGVNDSTAFRRHTAWRSAVAGLLDQVESRLQPRHILLSGVPPLSAFPALPWPLRTVLGLKSASLDRALASLAQSRSRTSHVPLPRQLADPALMASDGYHPSAAGCALWGGLLAAACPASVLAA